MQPIEVKKDIFWVGVVDFDHRDFHGYSRCPDGTTSNAYLIKDEKSALVDTVFPGKAGALLCRLAKTMPPEKVDYIVCNHMELDHQGDLEEVVERIRPEKIFVSAMGMKSMEGYYRDKGWPVVQALHAGVECGLFAGKLPDLDCVSFGPDMEDIHTPKESMNVESVKRTWLYTLEVLKRLR